MVFQRSSFLPYNLNETFTVNASNYLHTNGAPRKSIRFLVVEILIQECTKLPLDVKNDETTKKSIKKA